MTFNFIKQFLVILVIVISLTSCELIQNETILDTQISQEQGVVDIIEQAESFTMDAIPPYSGLPYIEVNGNIPFFSADEISSVAYEQYSPLDELGRCGVAIATVGIDIMPTEPRGEIGQVKPTGWHTIKYDIVDGQYLYNRCHLLGYQLTGENANVENLITGTRAMNVEGMLPFENEIDDYIEETLNHVHYRVTPIFVEDELLARGVLMEAMSLEDDGEGVMFNVFCYNAQSGIEIDYLTGESWLGDLLVADEVEEESAISKYDTYILNTSTQKIHLPDCSSVAKMNEKNKSEVVDWLDSLVSGGYDPCKICLDVA